MALSSTTLLNASGWKPYQLTLTWSMIRSKNMFTWPKEHYTQMWLSLAHHLKATEAFLVQRWNGSSTKSFRDHLSVSTHRYYLQFSLATFQYQYLNPGLSSCLGTHVSPSVEKIISCEDDASKTAFGAPVGERDVPGIVASSLKSNLNSSNLHPIWTTV